VIEANVDGAGDWQPVANLPFSAGTLPASGGLLEFEGMVPFGSSVPGNGADMFRVYAGPEASPLYELVDYGWHAELTASPASGYAPLDTQIGLAFFDDAGPFGITIDYGDGSPEFSGSSPAGFEVIVDHTFTSVGTYTVSATVTNTGSLGGELNYSTTVTAGQFQATDLVEPENWVEYDLQTGENWGMHSALALVADVPMMVYTRDDRDEIYFARATEARPTSLSDWVQMKVDDSDNLGGKLGIAEVYDVPCIVYEDTVGQDMFFAHAASAAPGSETDWSIMEVDTATPLRKDAQLAHVAEGPGIVYSTAGSIKYAFSNQPAGTFPSLDEHWTYEVVDADGSSMLYPAIVSALGSPAVAYQRADAGWLEVRYAWRSLTEGWQVKTIDDFNKNSGKNIRMLLVGDMGNPEVALAYQNVDIVDYLRYTHIDVWNPASSLDWQTITVRAEPQTHVGQWLGLSWVEHRPFMAYVNTGSGSTAGLQVSIATTPLPTGPGDFASGLLDDATGYFVNEQTNVLALDESTLFILYRTSEGLRFAYYTAP